MKHINAAGVVMTRTEKSIRYFLLIKHKEGGHWSFPKGKAETWETNSNAALRELHEETNLTASLSRLFETDITYQYVNQDGETISKKVTFFLGSTAYEPRITLSHEHSEYRWLPFDEALELLTYPEDKTVLKRVGLFLGILNE